MQYAWWIRPSGLNAGLAVLSKTELEEQEQNGFLKPKIFTFVYNIPPLG